MTSKRSGSNGPVIDPWTEVEVQNAKQLSSYDMAEMRNRQEMRRFTLVVLLVLGFVTFFGAVMTVFYRIDKGADEFWDTMGKIFLFGGGIGFTVLLVFIVTKLNVYVQRSDNGPLQAQADSYAQSQKAVWAVFAWMLQNQQGQSNSHSPNQMAHFPAYLQPPAGSFEQTRLPVGPPAPPSLSVGNEGFAASAGTPVTAYGQSSQMGLTGAQADEEIAWNA